MSTISLIRHKKKKVSQIHFYSRVHHDKRTLARYHILNTPLKVVCRENPYDVQQPTNLDHHKIYEHTYVDMYMW